MSIAAIELLRTEQASRSARAQPELDLLTVIVPVYNEAGTVDRLLQRVLAVPCQKQIIVMDDGSTDQTPLILERWQAHQQVEILRHPHNRGKGAAIRTALAKARARFTIIQDADLEYDPQDYSRLLEPLLTGRADVVYGSRYVRKDSSCHPPWSLFRLGVVLLNLCVRFWYGVRLTDEATCYKVFPTSLLRAMDLKCEEFEFCPEVTAKACRMGLVIHEVPIHYWPRGKDEGKKIRWRDGLAAVAALWRWRHWQPDRLTTDRSVGRVFQAHQGSDTFAAVGLEDSTHPTAHSKIEVHHVS
jgi:dolichol-phosphate mannosyltransferase